MGITLENTTKTVQVMKEERTWRIEIFSEKGNDYQVKIHREVVEKHDGEIVEKNRNIALPTITRYVSDLIIRDDSFQFVGGDGVMQTCRYKDLVGLVSVFADIITQEEKDKLI